ncbi:MAG: [FeFe] hydrogenase H-cluster radical SAM maturase HydG [Candidatus Omnitrophica bacterium]|nr:[FeFe] hydrogenase H-cluster radical SAM maturase HydG [Candidatus Omnitrophota bacterium]
MNPIKDMKSWQDQRIKKDEVLKYMPDGRDFIPEAEIFQKLHERNAPDKYQLQDLLAKSLDVKDLSPDEAAALMKVTDPRLLAMMKDAALKVKKKVYDNRIVTFAPLYLGNFCVNNCAYCGYKTDNREAKRRVLSTEEIRREVEVLTGEIGHKRLIVVYGEHPKNDVDFIISSIRDIYDVQVKTKHGHGNIRRVNVNASPFSVEDFKRIHDVGIGTYQVFQETYHHETYQHVHPSNTVKGDYHWRLYAMHRAFEAGIDDVGIGALFGLYDWKFEVMALIYHARELIDTFGIGPHTVSFPRLEPALNMTLDSSNPYTVSDEDFIKIILVIRLAIPYTGMIITARENAQLRREAINIGVTQTDASTRIDIGGYTLQRKQQESREQQFILGDMRSLEEVVREFASMGYITSFCTAGYRCGRTGKCIMDLLRNGMEGKFCKLNAILTFKEWIDDFASAETKMLADPLLHKELEDVRLTVPEMYPAFIEYYKRIEQGERDLYI